MKKPVKKTSTATKRKRQSGKPKPKHLIPKLQEEAKKFLDGVDAAAPTEEELPSIAVDELSLNGASERKKEVQRLCKDGTPDRRFPLKSYPGSDYMPQSERQFTLEKRLEFLHYYRTGMSVRAAAAHVGTTGVTVFNTVRKDEEFAKQYHAAREVNTDGVEDYLHTQAGRGNVTAIFGILKARRPSVWRENHQVNLSGEVTVKNEAADKFFAALTAALTSTTALAKGITIDGETE